MEDFSYLTSHNESPDVIEEREQVTLNVLVWLKIEKIDETDCVVFNKHEWAAASVAALVEQVEDMG